MYFDILVGEMLKIKKLDDLNKWYHHSRLAIIKLEDRVQGNINIQNEQKDFLGMTRNEIRTYFQKLQNELETAYVFKIISVAEGIFRQDFNKRKQLKKPKKEPDRTFKNKDIKGHIRLKEDILDIWKKKIFEQNQWVISQFYELLKYRHWIAHGQYWIYKQKIFDMSSTVTITINLLNECIKMKPDFNQHE